MTASRHLALAILLALTQAIFVAHAYDCSDDNEHEEHSCQVCHLAERGDDALPPIQFFPVASSNISMPSNVLVEDIISERIVRSADSRAPPLNLNEK
ncbi:MAG: hypothetical protein AAF936_13040 [Pseudomonadota bacterium]